jgi:superfamily II DNA or RNA helicase
MHEQAPQPSGHEARAQTTIIDRPLAEQALGFGIPQASDFLPEGMHDERRRIYALATSKAFDLRDTLVTIAGQQGIEVTQEQIDAWTPDDAQSDFLNAQLRKERQRLRIMEGISAYNDGDKTLRKGVKLREHQNTTLSRFSKFLVEKPPHNEVGGKKALIKLPTGTGKTGAFSKLAEAAKSQEDPNDPVRVLILVPTQQLVNQTIGKGTRSSGLKKFAPDIDAGGYYEHSQELEKEVVVMCTPSFNILVEKGEMPHFDMVIADEAHTTVGPLTRPNLENYTQDKILLGLSATTDKAVKMYGKPIYSMELDEAICQYGLLANVTARLLEASADIDESTLPENKEQREKIKQVALFKARMAVALPKIKDAISRDLGVVIRVPAGGDIAYAKLATKILRGEKSKEFDYMPYVTQRDQHGRQKIKKVTATEIGGTEQSAADKEFILNKYDSGELDVLIHVKQLGMGWDSPRAKAFFNLDPTSTNAADDLVQNFGRVLRLYDVSDPRDPNKRIPVDAEAWDFVDENLGENQYTCANALNCRPGEYMEYSPSSPSTPPKLPEALPDIQVQNIQEQLVGELAMKFLGEPEDDILPTPDGVTLQEGALWLGISTATLGHMLSVDRSTILSADELNHVLAEYPALNAAPLPERGYISLDSILEQAGIPPRKKNVIATNLRAHGYTVHRYRTASGFNYYLSEEDLDSPELLELV